MTTLTETGHAGGFLISEATGNRSRDNVTLASGQVILAGQVLGIVTATGKYAKYDNDAATGVETARAISVNDADATDGDLTIAVIIRDAEVNAEELVYLDTSPSDATAAAVDLKSIGIIVR